MARAEQPRPEPDAAPRVLVVTVNYRTAALAMACARTVAAQREGGIELRMALVDNASPDDSLDQLRKGLGDLVAEGWLTITALDRNGGFGWANNQAILMAQAQGWQPDYIWLLNPDCTPRPGALRALLAAMDEHPDAGAVGSQLLDEAGEPCASVFRFPGLRNEFFPQIHLARIGALLGTPMIYIAPGSDEPVDWVTGASVMLRRAALAQAGLFDDGFFLYFEEVELMHRLRRAGWRCRQTAASQVVHIGGAATGVNDAARAAAKPRPAYWFASRRRYFARTRGPFIAWLSGLGWQLASLAGPLVLRLRGRTDPPSAARQDRATMRKVGLVPAWHDRQPAFARLTDPPGTPPRWEDWPA